MMRYQTKSEKETLILAKKFAQTFQGGEVIALYGNLGAGKTVFTKGIAAGLGIKVTITSPTFTIMNVYPLKYRKINTLVHIDCYRLKDASELEAIGVREYLHSPHTVIVIEWAERVTKILKNKKIYKIKLELKNDGRLITITT